MGKRVVIVCDTNVLISALGWRGAEWQIYRCCRDGRLQLAISPALLEELRRVLRYPKLSFSDQEIASFEAELETHVHIVQPSQHVQVVQADPADDRVLECALAAKASYIISGDRHLLNLKMYDSIQILSASRALEVLADLC